MAEPNGHDPTADSASEAELDALLEGLFEPTTYEVAPGRVLEIRPLMVGNADKVYSGELRTAGELQTYMLEKCVFLRGRPLGAAGVARLPFKLASELAELVQKVNAMNTLAGDGDGKATDPKA